MNIQGWDAMIAIGFNAAIRLAFLIWQLASSVQISNFFPFVSDKIDEAKKLEFCSNAMWLLFCTISCQE